MKRRCACVWKPINEQDRGPIVTLEKPITPKPVVLGWVELPVSMTSSQFNKWVQSEDGLSWAHKVLIPYSYRKRPKDLVPGSDDMELDEARFAELCIEFHDMYGEFLVKHGIDWAGEYGILSNEMEMHDDRCYGDCLYCDEPVKYRDAHFLPDDGICHIGDCLEELKAQALLEGE